MTDAVIVRDLVKRYRRSGPPAVDGLSFRVRSGEIFGLLGPNGAGKTTTVGVLTTRVLPTSGQALVYGVDVRRSPSQARQLFAVVPQRNNLDRSLTIRQNLVFHAAYHGLGRTERNRRADEILDRMGLADLAGSRVDLVSGGQAQRVMIARALMHEPRVLFLDEPTTGLDPQARLFVHERVAALREAGVTVVLTTHDMEEAAKLCDRVGIVDHGRLLALDSPQTLTTSLPGSATMTLTASTGGHDREKIADALQALDGVERVETISRGGPGAPMGPPPGVPGVRPPGPPGPPVPHPVAGPAGNGEDAEDTAQFRLYTEHEPAIVLPSVLKALSALGCDLSDLSLGTPSLEDVFIGLTGRELR
ncbi:ABC transporter ATP-binding protein [Amycolatopsis cynarae]|uniref:ABC transporter ATP-binding protein n=1 Tax=Amycolatopsis cynarae TaxID=2995223 RepID=A0ABY7B3C1_9PSEU|nr:ABC transporter ATP-binding protein [Amycolatopsis sp. HUAS 11-8]WAL66681.1 ABC transporter ATP-binding protein [Amycolatopsis sp. HUAS 11-8]